MTFTERSVIRDDVELLISSARDTEELALAAVRKFVDTVNGILPDVRDDRCRRKIIDTAVEMTEQLVGVSSELARRIGNVATDAWAGERATSG